MYICVICVLFLFGPQNPLELAFFWQVNLLVCLLLMIKLDAPPQSLVLGRFQKDKDKRAD